MTRRAAVIVLALTLIPAVLHAQDAVLTVTVPSADVHKGPSTVTPVIGHVSRGAALPVSRNLGSWVRIPWPSAPDGMGYLHVTMGRLSAGGTEPSATPTRSTSASTPKSEAGSTPPPVSTPPRARTPSEPRVGVQGAQGVTTITHVVGVGGVIQSRGFGATGRAWHGDRLGFEFRFTRNSMTSDAATRVTSVELEPRVVYALFDHVSDYVWVRPYVGSGLTFSHRTLTVSSPATIDTASNNRVGLRVFGGGELTFASVTRFGLSAELGYRPSSTPFPGFETDRLGLSIAGHWYIK
jgi:opacity protein-like surface antigen